MSYYAEMYITDSVRLLTREEIEAHVPENTYVDRLTPDMRTQGWEIRWHGTTEEEVKRWQEEFIEKLGLEPVVAS